MNARPEEIVSLLREEIEGYDNKTRRTEEGTVLEVGDGIATVYGLDRAVYGELVELDTGVTGMVMNLSRDSVGVVLLGSEAGVKEGTVVRRTGRAVCLAVMAVFLVDWTYSQFSPNQGEGITDDDQLAPSSVQVWEDGDGEDGPAPLL